MTHILMTFLTAIMAFIYVCVNVKKLKDKEILKTLGINIIFIFGITAFFWIPMIETYFYTDYEVYQENSMATMDSFRESGLNVKTLLYTEKGATHVFEIGIPILVMLSLSILVIKKGLKYQYKKEYIVFFILGILCTIITIKQIPWGIFGEIFQIIQFKWRMLLFSNFFLAVICAINMYSIIKNFQFKDVMIISMISLLYVAILEPFIPINAEIQEIDQYTVGNVTQNKAEVIIGMGKGEYLPVKANEHREYITKREDSITILKGEATIYQEQKNGEILTCQVDILEDATILEFPYIFYPGYRITINGNEIEGIESENGFLAVSINEVLKANVKVEYKETITMFIAKMISVVSCFILCINIFYKKEKEFFLNKE